MPVATPTNFTISRAAVPTMKQFIFAIALSWSLAVPALGGDCGEKTTETLASSSEWDTINAGEVRSIRGTVLHPDDTRAEFIIVEVYRNDLATPVSKITYVQVNEIINRGRIAAVETGTSGKFCFKNLKPGNYMLRANMGGERISLSAFKMMNIFVTLAPRNKKGIQRELKIQLEMAI